MMTSTSPSPAFPHVMAMDEGPSDEQLLLALSLLLATPADTPLRASRFSALVEHVCEAYCPAEAVADRARRLEVALAAFLNERRVLRFRQVSPAGLDDWAAGASVVFVHAAVRACALCRGGDDR